MPVTGGPLCPQTPLGLQQMKPRTTACFSCMFTTVFVLSVNVHGVSSPCPVCPRLSSAAAHSPTPFQNPIYSSNLLLLSIYARSLLSCDCNTYFHFVCHFAWASLISIPPVYRHSSSRFALSVLSVDALSITPRIPLSILYYSGFLPTSKKSSLFQVCSPP